jgi:flagellar L-ring protein precursor FlgH
MFKRLVLCSIAAVSLSACAGQLDSIGKAPDMSPILNPVQQPTYMPVTMPMPRPEQQKSAPGSLWRTGSRSFLDDNRASRVGDILTVTIDIDEKASLSNSTTRSRNGQESASVTGLFGFEGSLDKILPDDVNPGGLLGLNGLSTANGSGSAKRSERVQMKIAAVIVQVLENGNYVIQGTQEVRINFERRDLQIAGVVRPQDITSANSITYDKIAEARISYGGKGQITNMQQPRWGQQVIDLVAPF